MGKQAKKKRELRAQRPLIVQGPEQKLPDWTPFKKIRIEPEDRATAEIAALEQMTADGHDRAALIQSMEELRKADSYLNSRYLVHVYRLRPPGAEQGVREIPDMVHLHIKRRDYKALGIEHFRDVQRIKNELVGRECEGVELYPAEHRLVDTGNSFHLWVIDDPNFEWPFGFNGRMVQESKLSDMGTPLENRPFDEPTDPEAPQLMPVLDQLHPHRPAPPNGSQHPGRQRALRAVQGPEVLPSFSSPPAQIADIVRGIEKETRPEQEAELKEYHE